MTGLAARLEALYAGVDADARVAADPIAFARRYADPADQEIAGLVAALLAYGRVDLFRPVIATVLAEADRRGGPRAWVDGFDPRRDAEALLPIVYRWNRGIDLVLLAATLREATAGGPLGGLVHWRGGDVAEALDGLVVALRDAAVRAAPTVGIAAPSFAELPRGFRTLLPRPADGSACKRWMMYLRWMVRPPREGIDLGLWDHVPPRALLVPVDTHVHRIATLVGLTGRADGSLATAREITANLARIDPDDPVRFDFALAHLGISGACRREPDPAICPACPLQPVCVIGSGRRRTPRRAARR